MRQIPQFGDLYWPAAVIAIFLVLPYIAAAAIGTIFNGIAQALDYTVATLDDYCGVIDACQRRRSRDTLPVHKREGKDAL